MRDRAPTALAGALLALLLSAAPAAAGPWIQHATPTGPHTADQRINYPGATDGVQIKAWPVGDMNGDGLDDFAMTAQNGDGWVAFSRAAGGTFAVGDPGTFHVTAPNRWTDVTGVGDINGDGLGDVAVAEGQTVAVVFGKRDDAPVDLANLGAGGFTISGVADQGRLAGVGDVDGDGVPDIVVTVWSGFSVVYPSRDAAGTTIDASTPGRHVSTVWTGSGRVPGNLGDVDGDGRNDLMLDTGPTVYGVKSPPPGQSVIVDSAGPDVFVVHDDDSYFWEAATIGDQNGDGRRDLLFPKDSSVRVAYAPRFGETIDIRGLGPAPDARGYLVPGIDLIGPTDVGDQDGDGRADLGAGVDVLFGDQSRAAPFAGGFKFDEFLVGAVSDVNGDGRPEIATLDDDGWTRHALDVYDSYPAPRIGPVTFTVDSMGFIRAATKVATGGASTRSHSQVELSSRIQVARPDGSVCDVSDGNGFMVGIHDPVVDFTGTAYDYGPTACGLVDGQTYSVRLQVGNGRGGVATSPWGQIVAKAFNPFPNGFPISRGGGGGVHGSLPTVLRGTSKADRIVGTARDERIFGNAGNDRIDGRGGKDLIDAGAGNDVVKGGTGNDQLIGGGGTDRFDAGSGNDWINSSDGKAETVDCGAGKDSVVADKKDRVRHCEKVRRRR